MTRALTVQSHAPFCIRIKQFYKSEPLTYVSKKGANFAEWEGEKTYRLVAIIHIQGRKGGRDKGINEERQIKHKKWKKAINKNEVIDGIKRKKQIKGTKNNFRDDK
jgi:hypothetical protein